MTNSPQREVAHDAAQIAARRILSVREVLHKRGGSRSKLWRDIRAGKFCAPVQTGENSIGFYSDEVEADINSLPRVAYAPNPQPT